MGRQRKDKPRFAGWIEKLEDRRVMSADPLLDSLPPVDLTSTLEPPPVDQHVLDQPDFWIDTSLQTGLDGYFDQVDQMLNEAHNLTGWWSVQNNYGFTGRGQTVAVIDTGIAWNHFALGGGFGAGYRVVGGWDFTEENDGVPYDDAGGHGTHVSGIIGSSASGATGVSPGVDLVGLRVFNDGGQGFFHWIESALQWIHNNRNSFANPITAVNLSLGVASYNSATIPLWANLEEEFAQLEADGIFIAVSAGNSFGDFGTPGLSYPAASPYVVPVMSTGDSGFISSYSQRLGRAIAAPGESIVSTVPDYQGNGNGVGDDFGAKSGTSMAAPYVAGASTLIRQAMQFVGMTGITQDTIYNHMMATADNVYDGVTGITYKRLNLARAIDSLMPTDDYGSTAPTAYNLGSFNGTVSRNGKIGSKSDVDCFTFTAATTGKVTFSANCTMGMAPSWQLWGGTSLPSAAGTLSFNIIAGQTYTLGLSTTTCVGNYTLGSTLDSSQPFTFTDWGPASFNQTNDLSVSGEKWYRVQATRTGTLTAMGTFNPAGGNVNFALYNSSLQFIINGTTTNGQARADVAATSGNYYFLKVTGANADVDFKVANLVSLSGGTVTVAATSGADDLIFHTAAFHWLSVNGVSYGFALGAANRFNFDGGDGADTMQIYGSSAAEAYTLRQGSATLASSALTVTAANMETQYVGCSGGGDTMEIFDSTGDDAFHLGAGAATLFFANGDMIRTWAFSHSVVNSTAGNDRVDLYDTLLGNETVNLWAGRALLSGNGYFSNDVRGFDVVAAHASGGNDRVTFYDSSGADTYSAWSDHATMSGPGYANHADGFDQMSAVSNAGGADVANLYDSSGNDGLQLSARSATFTYAGGVSSVATGFTQVLATSAAGYDYVDLYDTAADDAISLWSDRGLLVGGGCTNDVRGFDLVTARYQAGGADVVTLYDSAGDDYLQMSPRYANFKYAGGAETKALGFNQQLGVSSAGYDMVDFFDSRGNDTATLWFDRAVLTGSNFANDARGFDLVSMLAWYGGNDLATFYDSAGDDAYSATTDRSTMSGLGFSNNAYKFEQTLGIANAGGFDTATIFDSAANDQVLADLSDMAIRGAGFDNLARGFDEVNARLVNGGQNKLTRGAQLDYAFNIYGSYIL